MLIHMGWLALGAFAGMWTGCQSTPPDSKPASVEVPKAPTGVATEPPRASLSLEEELKLKDYEAEVEVGRSMAGRLLQQFKPIQNKDLTAYVSTVGEVVAAQSPFRDRHFVFGILDTDTINAFAMPGGYIFVTRGALAAVRSEAELAAILGHEIAHVGKRHIFNAMIIQSSQGRAGGEGEDPSKVTVPQAVTARRRPASSSSATAETLAAVIGGGAGGSFKVLAAVQGGLGLLLDKGLDPKLEYEADREGVQYALAAGYEPRAMVEYFARVLSQKESQKTAILSRTHPTLETRIKGINASIAGTVPADYRGALGEERFKAIVGRAF